MMKLSTSLIRIRYAVGVMLALSAVFAVVLGTTTLLQHTQVVEAQQTSSNVSFGEETYDGEEGETVEVVVMIDSPRASDVTIPLVRGVGTATPGSDHAPIPQNVTIDAGDLSATVSVDLIDDDVDEGETAETIIINFGTLPSGITSAPGASTTVSITDNDTAGVSASQSNLGIVEGDVTTGATYAVVLDSEPTGDVEVTISGQTEFVTISGATLAGDDDNVLEFTADNWDVPQTIKVTAADDESTPTTATLTHTASNTGGYTDSETAEVQVAIANNDSPAISINPTALSADEGGSTSYTIRLSQQPAPGTGNVTVTVSGQGTGDPLSNDVSLSGSALSGADGDEIIFNRANWNVPRRITVNVAEDDDAETDNPVTLTHNADGGGYAGAAAVSVTITSTDNDTKEILVSREPISVDEGDQAGETYRIKLSAEPNATVNVAIAPDNSGVTVLPNSISFNANNWDEWSQLIRITVLEDPDAINDETDLTHTASGGGFEDVVKVLKINEQDDDVVGITIAPDPIEVDEGESVTYTVVLDRQPSADVNITLTVPDDSGLEITTPGENADEEHVLTFTDQNSENTQNVTVNATENGVDDGDRTIDVTHTASGGGYDDVAVTAAVMIEDDDTAGFTFTGDPLNVTEDGAADTYTIVLASEPTGDVTVMIDAPEGVTLMTGTGDDEEEITSLTFTLNDPDDDEADNNGNWDEPQTVSVTADDDIDNDESPREMELTHTATGGGYGAVEAATVTLNVTDEDVAGVTVDTVPDVEGDADTEGPQTTPVAVMEGDADGGSYTVVLNSEPTEDVTIEITGHAETDARLSSDTLTFTADNWDDPQTVTVTLVEDDDAEAEAEVTLAHVASTASEENSYDSVTIDSVTVNFTDDDAAGVSVSTPSLEFVEGDDQDFFTVVLDSQPTGSVAVTVTSNNTGVASVLPTSITFTTTNWATPRRVSVNPGTEGTSTITLNPDNGGYAAVDSATVTVTVVDSDAPAISVSPINITVDEGDTTGESYTVRLTQAPTDDEDVTVTVTGHANTDLTIAGSTLNEDDELTFTSTNWNVMQTITVTAAEDDDAAVDTAVVLTHTADNAGGYTDAVTATVNVSIEENDENGITVSREAITVAEGDTTGVSYTVVLDAEPSANVIVTIAGHGVDDINNLVENRENDVSISGTTLTNDVLTFTMTNWDTPQTVTVIAVEDADAVTDEDVELTHTADNAGGYTPDVTAEVTVSITDDDIAAIRVDTNTDTDEEYETTLEIVEGGETEMVDGVSTPVTYTYTVTLTATPDVEVTVTIGTPEDSGVMLAEVGETAEAEIELTFGANTAPVPQTVTVTLPGDDVAQGDRSVVITHTASTTVEDNDNVYDGVTATVTLAITEDDRTILKLVDGDLDEVESLTLIEDDPNDIMRYYVVLDSAPEQDVTVTVTAPEGLTLVKADGTRGQSIELMFEAPTEDPVSDGTWEVPQQVDIFHSGPDDVDQGASYMVMVTHSASGGYGSMTLPVTITDNDFQAISTVPAMELTTIEGSTQGDTYTVELLARPRFPSTDVGELTVTITPKLDGSATQLVTVTPSELTFTAANFASAQVVTVKAAAGSLSGASSLDFTLEHLISTEGITFGTDRETSAIKVLELTVHSSASNATGKPVINGSPLQVGTTLTAGIGNVDDPNGLGTLSYEWRRGTVPVGTDTTYTVVADDVGQNITVTVSFDDLGGTAESRTSDAVRIYGAVGPVIIQTAQTLEADLSDILAAYRLPADHPFTFVWSRNGTAIPGNDRDRLTLGSADDGATFTVSVTFMHAGEPVTRTSAAARADVTAIYAPGQISEIRPAIRGVTVSAGDTVRLEVLVYGLQGVQDQDLADGVSLDWTVARGDATPSTLSETGSRISYRASDSPGTYTVMASLSDRDCRPDTETDREADCSAEFEVRVRRPTAAPVPVDTPQNPPGEIPTLLTDDDGNQYEVFTPEGGGTFTGESYTLTAGAGAIPNGEYIGIRVSDEGSASNAGMTHQRYTLGGNMFSVSAVDASNADITSYALNSAATVCVPLPDELRSNISNLALVAINADGSLTILSASVRLGTNGTLVCGNLSGLPASVAVGSAGAPAPLPTPVPPTATPEAPDTGGAAPASNAALWALLLGFAVVASGTFLVIGRRRESSSK